MLWHYAKGKPKETVAHEGALDLAVTDRSRIEQEFRNLTTEQLRQIVAHYDAVNRIKAGEADTETPTPSGLAFVRPQLVFK
jgi:hypothetical protein